MLRLIRLTLLGAALLLPLSGAYAQSDESHIQYRQKVMGSLGANMGAIGDILKNRLPHQGNIAEHARAISISAGLIPSAFEERVTEGPTDAKAEVWSMRGDFEDAVRTLEERSARLAEVASSGDMQAIVQQVKAVGDACGSCHDEYRVPKEQSYKRR